MMDIFERIITQLEEGRNSKEDLAAHSDRFEVILGQCHSGISNATGKACRLLERLGLDTPLVYRNRSGEPITATKRGLLQKFLTFPGQLETLAYDALEELERAPDETTAKSILGFFQAEGLELIEEIDRLSLATEQVKEAVTQ